MRAAPALTDPESRLNSKTFGKTQYSMKTLYERDSTFCKASKLLRNQFSQHLENQEKNQQQNHQQHRQQRQSNQLKIPQRPEETRKYFLDLHGFAACNS